MVRLAQSGVGIACVPREYVRRELEEGSLIEIKTAPPLPARGVGLAVPKNVAPSFAGRAFC